MIEAFHSGGILMWPLLAIGIGILVLAVRAAFATSVAPDGASEARLRAILFWGMMAALLGLLGTAAGILQMAQAVSLAGTVEPALVYGGIGVALVTLVFGLLILLFAALCWFLLLQGYLRGTRPAGVTAAAE